MSLPSRMLVARDITQRLLVLLLFTFLLTHPLLIMMCKLQKRYSFHFYGPSRVRTAHPKLGVFFKIVKIQLFDCFIAQLVKKLQQWSLYEVIEDILPFVLNTKRPLSDIWLVSYKQNSFGCFL